jgi:hypothetical protein
LTPRSLPSPWTANTDRHHAPAGVKRAAVADDIAKSAVTKQLGKIFSTVTDGEEDGAKTAKNIRLTCHRFEANSSHLLIKEAVVCVTDRSLTRFQEIARHPHINKGISSVRLDVSVFTSCD